MKNQVYQKKKNEDGTDYIDPITNDFVMELILEEDIEIPIAEALEYKLQEIDNNTQDLIYRGFEYNGLIFSLSSNAQINWLAIPTLPEQMFPLTILSKYDEPYELKYSEVMNFYLTAVNGKNMHLQSGSQIKMELVLINNSEEILNYKDPRIENTYRKYSKDEIRNNIINYYNPNIFKRIINYIKNLF